jgi:predicted membrane GTPase involved in stress response
MGIPEVEARVYEGKVKNGNILIAVHTDDSDHTKRIREIFENAGAEDIKVASTKKAPTPERRDEPVTRR